MESGLCYTDLMLVLGIDPGTETTGYSLLKLNGAPVPELVKYDWIKTLNNGFPEKRLDQIFRGISAVIEEYKPDVMAMEKVFFFSNAKTVIRVSQAQGVFLLAAARYKIPVHEYAPGQIKKVISGNGRADKKEMIKIVLKTFNIRIPKGKKTHFNDVCDALAIGLTHIRMTSNTGSVGSASSTGKR